MTKFQKRVDPKAVNFTYSGGVAHLRIDGRDVLTMSPEVAAWISGMARTAAVAALEADRTAYVGGWMRELLMDSPRYPMSEAEYQALTSDAEKD